MHAKRIWAIITIAAVGTAASAAHAETTVAVIDVARVFEEYEMTRDLEAKFDERRRAANDEANNRRNSIEQMRRSLAAFDPVSEDFARREQDLLRAEVDFEVWSTHTERQLKAEHKKWLLRIYRNAQKVVGDLAKERQVGLVLTYDRLAEDAADSIVLRQQILLQKVIYHDEETDITAEVLNRLNQSYRAGGGAQSLDRAPGVPSSGGQGS